jgi:hydroxyethylthiazole kinase-like uncharacterized protein yjeF
MVVSWRPQLMPKRLWIDSRSSTRSSLAQVLNRRQLIDRFDGLLILDAGALNVIDDPALLSSRTGPTVLTPHAGEFARLSGEDPSWESAARLAEITGAIVLLKGNPTVVAGPDVIVVDTGGPELATIGSGDVLAGIIGAFGSVSSDTMSAVTSAAYIHGLAGAKAATSSTVTVLDILEAVGPVVASLAP